MTHKEELKRVSNIPYDHPSYQDARLYLCISGLYDMYEVSLKTFFEIRRQGCKDLLDLHEGVQSAVIKYGDQYEELKQKLNIKNSEG